MIATFVIFLREGIEASLIVAILLAYLDKLGRRDLFKDIFLGVAAAVVLAAAGGIAAYLTIKTYAGSRFQTEFETVTYLIATALLTFMTFWMRSHSTSMSRDLTNRAQAGMDGKARFALSMLAFQAVGREGLETAVFTLAILFAQPSKTALWGGAAGMVIASGIAFAIFRMGKKLNLAKFFNVVGAVLMIFAAGLLADAVENAQRLGWIHFFSNPLWNSGHLLSENSAMGDVFHSLIGYADRPTFLQAIFYIGYLAIALVVFLAMKPKNRQAIST